MENKYHLKYRNINREAIIAVRTAIKAGLFKKTNTLVYRKEVIDKLHAELCRIYELPKINIVYIDDLESIGTYNITMNIIAINKPSLVTYLHEFCHYIRVKSNKKNTEEIARGWSISLFYLATPKLCLQAIEKGLIMFEGGNESHV